MQLSDYPRPPADTGWGMHDSASYLCRPSNAQAYARYLRQELGITWFKALVAGTNKVDLARAFIQQGIEVVVRLYAGEPHPHYVVTEGEVRAYVDAGVHYFEWGNEPNLVVEWNRSEWDRGARVDRVCQQFLRNAEVIKRAGGIPLFPALSPGGDYPHRDWYRTTFDWLRIHGHLSALDGAALAIHNRPLSPWTTAEYQWIDDRVRSYLGHSLPLLGTEAGWEPAWVDNDLQQHAALNIDWLRGARQGRWRDCLFCECLWLVDNFGHGDFGEAAWHNNGRYGGDLPAVGALRADWRARPFARQFAWDAKSLEASLGERMQAHVIPQNPAAGFYAYGRRRGWEPISREVDLSHGGITYRCQAWYSPADRMQHIVYAPVGAWGRVAHFDRSN